jgi:hypothetical protein
LSNLLTIAGNLDGPLFRTTGCKTGTPHAMWQQDAYRQRRAAGITTYVKNDGTPDHRASEVTASLFNARGVSPVLG